MDDLSLDILKHTLVGKSVTAVHESKLILDDDTMLYLYMSDSDCCASAGGTWVTNPENLECIITDVKFNQTKDREGNGDGAESEATITLLHNQNPIAQADCYANDGNGGYYFSVLSLSIETPRNAGVSLKVIQA